MKPQDIEEQENPVQEEKGVSLGELFHMIIKHWKGLVVSVVACIIIAIGYAFLIQKPEWSSTGTIIVLASNDEDTTETPSTGTINSSNLSLSINLVPTLVDFIASSSVLSNVAIDINQESGTSYSTKNLQSMLSVSARTYTSLEKSLYIDITATTNDEALSKAIVNSTLETAIEMANDESLTFSKVFSNSMTITSYADEPVDTSTSKFLILLIGAVIGVIIGAVYGLIFELCNTHVISQKELEALTGLNVIGTIPEIETGEKEGGKDNE